METDGTSYEVPFTSDSSLAQGFHVSASLGGGVPHAFIVDTGSVGILVPRQILGPDYQDFDSSLDIEFQYVSSGNAYWGQWVSVPVVLGVPADWDGTGDYPIAQVAVFAADQPADPDFGVMGIGFSISGVAGGPPSRNPLLNVSYQGSRLLHGYIVSTGSIKIGLNSDNMERFAFIPLVRDSSDEDWLQPLGSFSLTGGDPTDLPLLVDTGLSEMILWTTASNAPPCLPSGSAFPAGTTVSVSAPPADQTDEPALQYSFTTGETSQPMAPSYVEWREGNGINTGRNVLAGADYLYDATVGRIGFRIPPA